MKKNATKSVTSETKSAVKEKNVVVRTGIRAGSLDLADFMPTMHTEAL